MKYRPAIVKAGYCVLLGMSLTTSLPSNARDTNNKKITGVSYVHEDGGRLDIVREPEDLENDHFNFLGQIVDHYKYLVVRQPEDRAYIAAYFKGRHLFSVPDQEVGINGGGNWQPGEAANGYDFHMSPDRRYLFVNRYSISHLDVALLYKKTDRGWTAAGPERFDDSALEAFCRSRHVNEDDLAGPSRMVRILKWDRRRGSLVFYMAAASFWFSDESKPGDTGAEWIASCRLRDMRFRILSGNVYRFHKPGSFPWKKWPKSMLH